MQFLLCLLLAVCLQAGWLAAQTDSIPHYLNALKVSYDQGDLATAQPLVDRVLGLDAQNYHALKYKQLIESSLRAKQALAAEDTIDVKTIKPNSIVIANFTNTGTQKNLDPLQKGLAEMLITDLAQVQKLTIIERAQMQALYNEMGLSQTGLVDPAKTVQLGKVLGAATVVTGSFKSDDGQALAMDAALAGVIGAKSRVVEPVKGTLPELFKMEKKLVFDIVKKMGIVLTDAERKKIETVPTENVLAFLAYSQGLDAEDLGDFSAAQSFYAEAVRVDPNMKTPAVQPMPAVPPPPPPPAPVAEAAAEAEAAPMAVFTVGNAAISGVSPAALSALNATNASFMPEAQVTVAKPADQAAATAAATAAEIPAVVVPAGRNSFIDSYGLVFDGSVKSVGVNAPIPTVP